MMHRLAPLVLALALAIPRAVAQDVTEIHLDSAQTASAVQQAVEGTRWVNDLGLLKAEAAAKGKLIYWVQLVGNLDEGL